MIPANYMQLVYTITKSIPIQPLLLHNITFWLVIKSNENLQIIKGTFNLL